MATRQIGILAWIHLARIYHQIHRSAVADLAKEDLTLPQFDVLAQLNRQEGITQQSLADHLLVTKGNICGLIDRMTEQGLVERRADPEDRRANMLHLTPKGKAVVEHTLPMQSALIAGLVGNLSPDKQRQLLDLLGELDRALERQ